jgi:hypothetical protein
MNAPWLKRRQRARHCEERSDEAIQLSAAGPDCFASIAMTGGMDRALEK